ncbi:hypothetical protein D7Y21_32640 [Corallococcus sp. AB045]|uniref:hypothetical protein n=1 Tax=Corallococcus sp. AB045 TaxID=2316719 RepID=UPI000EE34F59|nr:hypothetical protein [Corallococcus sp. AB045]RKH80161.1 hypothetical protein D7Y21_32640 [Corallococcus sp. AB045]
MGVKDSEEDENSEEDDGSGEEDDDDRQFVGIFRDLPGYIIQAIYSYLTLRDVSRLGGTSRRLFHETRQIMIHRLYWSRPPARAPVEEGVMVSRDSHILFGGWRYLKNIALQRFMDAALASENVSGRYAFDSPQQGGTNNPFTTTNVNTTVGVVKINGVFLGRFLTRDFHNMEGIEKEYIHSYKQTPKPASKGTKAKAVEHNHMEDHFLEAIQPLLEQDVLSPILEQLLARSTDGRTLVVTLKGTKTPCSKCAANLAAFATAYKDDKGPFRILMRCKAFGLYEGEKFQEQFNGLKLMEAAGVPIIPWGISERMKKTFTRQGFVHELANMNPEQNDEFMEHVGAQQDQKILKYFNLDKNDPHDAKYGELRKLLFSGWERYHSYSGLIRPRED